MRRRAFIGSGLSCAAGALLGGGGCSRARLLRIATNVWPGYESLYVARSEGRLGREVRLIELLSATQVLSAIRTGLVEAAALTLDETLLLVSRGVPLRIVGVFDSSAGADALVARGIQHLVEIRGARIGVESTALGAYFLSRALEKAGLSLADVKVVRLDVSEHERAFQAGRVDAVVTFDPVRARLVSLGGRVLFDSRQLPDEILDVLVARADVADDPSARRTLSTVLRACDAVVRSLSVGSPRFAKMSRRLSLSPEQVEQAFAGIKLTTLADSRRLLGGAAPPIERQAAVLAERLRAAGLLLAAPSVEHLADDRAVHGALA